MTIPSSSRLVERRFMSRAEPAAAWAHLTAVERWPSWARHIKRVRLDPPGALTPTTKGRLLLRPGAPTTFRMTALEVGRSWSWRGRLLGTTLDYDHVIEAAPGGTRITFTIDGGGATARVIGPVFAKIYGRILDRAIPNLVAELDSLAR
ncbi:MAG: SRPBCC family protein [Actinomycetota bacterium]